jgi:hypothetical protein
MLLPHDVVHRLGTHARRERRERVEPGLEVALEEIHDPMLARRTESERESSRKTGMEA